MPLGVSMTSCVGTREYSFDCTDWQTIEFKSLRLPGNGLVKLRILLKNFSGEVSFRSPRAKINLPKRDRSKDGERKKKKDKKKDN